nr:hypothetical protein [Tanacetum cinerariifolium]
MIGRRVEFSVLFSSSLYVGAAAFKGKLLRLVEPLPIPVDAYETCNGKLVKRFDRDIYIMIVFKMIRRLNLPILFELET